MDVLCAQLTRDPFAIAKFFVSKHYEVIARLMLQKICLPVCDASAIHKQGIFTNRFMSPASSHPWFPVKKKIMQIFDKFISLM